MRRSALRLRRYEHSDLPDFTALFGDPQVMRYVGEGSALDAAAATTLMDKIFEIYETDPSFFVWAVEQDAEYAGHAELKHRKGREEYEVVYILQRERWGRGLGGELCDLLASEARRRKIPFIIATVNPENLASSAILSRRGFKRDEMLSQELSCAAYRLNLDRAEELG